MMHQCSHCNLQRGIKAIICHLSEGTKNFPSVLFVRCSSVFFLCGCFVETLHPVKRGHTHKEPDLADKRSLVEHLCCLFTQIVSGRENINIFNNIAT